MEETRLKLPYYRVSWIEGGKLYTHFFKSRAKAKKEYTALKDQGIPAYWSKKVSHAITAYQSTQIELCNGFGNALIALPKEHP